MTSDKLILTDHAWARMCGRSLSPKMILRTIKYGRIIHNRKAVYYVIGKKEIARYRNDGIDLSNLHGIHVVCSSGGIILTCYRNRDLRGLKPTRRRRYNRRTVRPSVKRHPVSCASWSML